MSRHTRETTVVNQPAKFSIAAVSMPLGRSHASCTFEDACVWHPVIRALEAQKPLWQPGTKHVYHSITLASASHSFECSEHSRTADAAINPSAVV
jgi:hypothetical protein